MADAIEATKHVPATAVKATAAAPTPAVEEKKSITLTFTGADLALYESIVKDADEYERTPSGLLLRYIRQNYGKSKA